MCLCSDLYLSRVCYFLDINKSSSAASHSICPHEVDQQHKCNSIKQETKYRQLYIKAQTAKTIYKQSINSQTKARDTCIISSISHNRQIVTPICSYPYHEQESNRPYWHLIHPPRTSLLTPQRRILFFRIRKRLIR